MWYVSDDFCEKLVPQPVTGQMNGRSPAQQRTGPTGDTETMYLATAFAALANRLLQQAWSAGDMSA